MSRPSILAISTERGFGSNDFPRLVPTQSVEDTTSERIRVYLNENKRPQVNGYEQISLI